MNMTSPIDYAQSACDTMMRKYKASDLPPKGHFHYHQGVFLSGVYQTYLLTGNEAYFRYIKDWMDSVLDDNGNMKQYDHADLDDIQPGILLYPLLDKTGDERYRKAIDAVISQVNDVPRNEKGGFWHKKYLKDQMWLDGLYMAGPFCAEYAKRFENAELRDLVIQQAILMNRNMRDSETGLLYHAWDLSKSEKWADSKTGLSPEFWGRAIGWVPVALLDDLDYIDANAKGYDEMRNMSVDLLKAVCRFQSDDGRWYQVLDKGNRSGNWLENSCTSLFVAALCKAVRKGWLEKAYDQHARKGYDGVINNITWDGQDILIGNVCIGTGVGDYAHYCNRPVSINDLHGVGAFLLMCAEMQRLL